MESQATSFEGWDEHFIRHKSFLLSFAFRMLGSLSEAEDVVQDTFLACARTSPASVENCKAWLTRICTNKGLNHLKLAYKRRELYPGTWLPDQIPERLQIWGQLQDDRSPEEEILLSESLTTTFLLLLETLTPHERVVYLLSEVFDYSFREIASFLDKKETTCRKIAQRARESIASGQPRFGKPPPDADKTLRRFFSLAKNGEIQELTELFHSDSQLWGDGGGKAKAAGLVQGLERIANFYRSSTFSEMYRSDAYEIDFDRVNARPGIVIATRSPTGAPSFNTILSFEFQGSRIARIYGQRNPDKLAVLTDLRNVAAPGSSKQRI